MELSQSTQNDTKIMYKQTHRSSIRHRSRVAADFFFSLPNLLNCGGVSPLAPANDSKVEVASNDETLYREARAGSGSAFAALYARYEAPIFGFLLRRLRNRADTEDVFQEVMLSILNGSEARLIDDGAFAGWIYRVAANRCHNHKRAARRESTAMVNVLRDTENQIGAPILENSIQDALLKAEKREELERASRRLSPPLGDVYALRSAGRTHEEIAETLGVPVGTVKSRLHALVAQLRKDMDRWFAR